MPVSVCLDFFSRFSSFIFYPLFLFFFSCFILGFQSCGLFFFFLCLTKGLLGILSFCLSFFFNSSLHSSFACCFAYSTHQIICSHCFTQLAFSNTPNIKTAFCRTSCSCQFHSCSNVSSCRSLLQIL